VWKPSHALAMYARVLVRLRWLVVAFWLAATAAAVMLLPSVGYRGEDLSQLVSNDNPAVQSEVRSFEKFGFPLLSRVAVVQRNPHGLPLDIQTKAVTRARDLTEGKYPELKPIMAAVPITNALQALPGSKENGTTIITMLFTAPDVSLADQLDAANQFVAKYYGPQDAQVWGMHAWRWIDRFQEESQWNLIPRQGTGRLYNFGELHGIIHAAGVTGEIVSLSDLEPRDAARQFHAKCHGLYVLADLTQERRVDFVALFSSTASVLGGPGLAAYSAANCRLTLGGKVEGT